MADPRLVRYLKDNAAKGYPLQGLKQFLVQKGFDPQNVEAAAVQAIPLHASHKKLFATLFILITIVGLGIYFYNTEDSEQGYEPASPEELYIGDIEMANYNGDLFVMQSPLDWSQTSNEQFSALFLAPPRKDFSANLGVVLSELGDDAEAIAASAKSFQLNEYSGYKVLEEGQLAINGLPAYKRAYRWHNDDFDITQVQVWVQNDAAIYLMTATSLSEFYPQYEPVFEKMIESFNVK